MSAIEFRSDGRRILIPLLVMRPAVFDLTAVPAIALLDTGATTSGIALGEARQLGLPPLGKRLLGTARGAEQIERYVFRFGFQLSDQPSALPYVFGEFMGFELSDGGSFSALIGMDLLSQCDLRLKRDGSGSLHLP